MGKPWRWAAGRVAEAARTSNATALDNARRAATDLSRARVERDEVELYLRSTLGDEEAAPSVVRLA